MELFLLNASNNQEQTRKNFQQQFEEELTELNAQQITTLAKYPSNPDGIIITGSSDSVLDAPSNEWIQTMEEYVRRMYSKNVPMLGICWGHQLIAEALGGTVKRREKREIGIRNVRLTMNDFLTKSLSNPQTVFETHEDEVSKLPPEAKLLAYNSQSIQGFKVNDVIYGFQFHPEYGQKDMERVINKYVEDEKKEKFESNRLTEENLSRVNETSDIFSQFESLVKQKQSDKFVK